tara:strand:+ start:497 stop:835 length:339 start_codon:yes stop_codon:yes gene_type:complete
MIWPPVKAWTSKSNIQGHRHFVAINYGGKFLERWVIMISVLDSSVAVKVSWTQLVDPTVWECGWDGNNQSDSSKLVKSKHEIRTNICTRPSDDSGLTLPITQNIIRPWFINI